MPIPTRSFGCSWKPLTRADLADVADLVAAIEHLDDTLHRHAFDDLVAAFDSDSSDLEHNTVLLRTEEGTAIAYGWNRVQLPGDPPGRVHLAGGCHPGWRNRGVGATLIEWQCERAREWFAEQHPDTDVVLELVGVVDARNVRETTMLKQAGFTAQRWAHDLHQFFDPAAEPMPTVPIDGVTLIPFTEQYTERVRLTHNACVAGDHGLDAVSPALWLAALTAEQIRRDLSWVAVDTGGEVVGYALNAVPPGDEFGWTYRLGALPQWRNRGVLALLLSATLNSFRDARLQGAGIGVDSESDSGVRPYEALGYGVAESLVWYVRREQGGYSGARIFNETQDG